MSTIQAASDRSASKAWIRALELTAPIAKNPDRTFPIVMEESARKSGESIALLSDHEIMTYRDLTGRARQYARWALDRGLQKGDTVCLFMPNRPEYMAIWLGITQIGGIVSLLNTNLTGPSLAHCINIVEPKHIIVDAELIESFVTGLADLAAAPKLWIHGTVHDGFQRIDEAVETYRRDPLTDAERRPVTINDPALYIYTSGTTGLPKAANVSHFRIMQWSHWFAGLMATEPGDRMYNCLPMYHSVGGVVAIGATLAGGGSVVIRERFSASEFWSDVVRWNCTLFQYIGELCRYLLHTKPSADETRHHIRICCGNGLRPDIWEDFKTRFQIPQILEFYAATESNVSLSNIDGKPGAIGRIPSFLAHRFPAILVKFDLERQEPVRNEQGFCIRCAPNETGEAIGRILMDPANPGTRFEGYTSRKASEEKILRNVFEQGDAWFRTGDLMRKDEKGYFYFVDRIGDTFRWKGENVSTTDVSETICAFPGILEANVYGVSVPGTEGKAGMAALVAAPELDLRAFKTHLVNRLPGYARPIFLRLRAELDVTATFKHKKSDLVRDGYDPDATSDLIYFSDPDSTDFVRLDKQLFDRIQAGQIRF
jgi:fatty-acyl-CoA synthase